MDNSNSVTHNVYFEGKVQSLGLATEKGKATVGVMKSGTYTFSTSSAEKMIIISGTMNVRLPNQDWAKYAAQQEFDVVAGVSFEVTCDADVAYICYYE